MAILVDSPILYPNVGAVPKRHRKKRWSHLFSDSEQELHSFASKLNLKREWFQKHKKLNHYDITENIRKKAVRLGAIEVSCKFTVKFFKKSPESLLDMIRQDPYLIRYFKNPSYDLCETAITSSAGSLFHITNQTPEICELAIKKWPGSLQFVTKQTKSLCMLAVSLDGSTLKYVNKKYKSMVQKAIENYPLAIQYVPDSSKEVWLQAVRLDPFCVKFLPKPDEEIHLEAVRQNGINIQFIPDSSDNVKLEAVKQNPRSIIYITDPTQGMVNLVATNDSWLKEYMELRFEIKN